MTIPLTSEIKPFFSVFEEHVIKNFLTSAQGILSARTTNLNIVKDKLPGILENQQNTKPDSNYKRLIRFFNMDDADKQALIEAILCLRPLRKVENYTDLLNFSNLVNLNSLIIKRIKFIKSLRFSKLGFSEWPHVLVFIC